MKITKQLLRSASVGAVALGLVMGTAQAATNADYELDSGIAIPMVATAAVLNTVHVVTTDLAFGNIGVTSDAVDTATLAMSPAGVVTEDLAGDAHMIDDTEDGTPATVTITTAFGDSAIYVTYSNVVDLADAAGPDLIITRIIDNLDNPTVGVAGTAGEWTTSGTTVGIGTTTGAGALTFAIGIEISTVATAAPYDTNTYTGGFDMTMAY